jgi:hypothetical protein
MPCCTWYGQIATKRAGRISADHAVPGIGLRLAKLCFMRWDLVPVNGPGGTLPLLAGWLCNTQI